MDYTRRGEVVAEAQTDSYKVDRQSDPVSAQHLIKQLADSPFCFEYGITMVHGSGEVGVSKCNPSEWGAAQDLASGRLPTTSKEETWLRTQIGVSPAIQDNSGDVPLCVKAPSREHLAELLTDLSFIISERRSQQLGAASVPLLFG